MSVLQYLLSLQGPRGEQYGKALSGADFVCVVANPSTPTKKQSERVAFFVLHPLPLIFSANNTLLKTKLQFAVHLFNSYICKYD